MDEREANLKTEVNKYTDDAIAKIPTSAIRHTQSGTVTIQTTNRGGHSCIDPFSVALSGFINENKMIAIITPNYIANDGYYGTSVKSYVYANPNSGGTRNVLYLPALPFTKFTSSKEMLVILPNNVSNEYNGTYGFADKTYYSYSYFVGTYTVIEFY